MRLFEYIQSALENLLVNKLRSFLTTLGILIGVFNVVLVISVLQGGRAIIMEEIGSLGSNVISVYPLGEGYLTEKSMSTIKRTPGVKEILPEAYIMTQLKIGKESRDVFVYGAVHNINRILKIDTAEGRFISKTDEDLQKKVCVITEGLKQELFANSSPLGKEIKIEGNIFKIIGTAKEKTLLSKLAGGYMIYIPFSTAQRLLGTEKITYLNIMVKNIEKVKELTKRIKEILNQEYFGKDMFDVRNMQEFIDTTKMVTGILALIIACIAGISLIVGGIGIMNIMLVQVRERTHEIGIRKAFGASNEDIFIQFLIESCILSLSGGIVGIILGLLVTNVIVFFIKNSLSSQLGM
ncbi:MAG: ABC transporter permease, partial [bacterium]